METESETIVFNSTNFLVVPISEKTKDGYLLEIKTFSNPCITLTKSLARINLQSGGFARFTVSERKMLNAVKIKSLSIITGFFIKIFIKILTSLVINTKKYR